MYIALSRDDLKCIWEDMHRFYENTIPYSIRKGSLQIFISIHEGLWNESLEDPRDGCVCKCVCKISTLLHPFIQWCTLMLFPYLGYVNKRYSEQKGADIPWRSCFLCFGYISRNGIGESCGSSVSFLFFEEPPYYFP